MTFRELYIQETNAIVCESAFIEGLLSDLRNAPDAPGTSDKGGVVRGWRVLGGRRLKPVLACAAALCLVVIGAVVAADYFAPRDYLGLGGRGGDMDFFLDSQKDAAPAPNAAPGASGEPVIQTPADIDSAINGKSTAESYTNPGNGALPAPGNHYDSPDSTDRAGSAASQTQEQEGATIAERFLEFFKRILDIQ